jgi:uncharacterized protein (DUF2267 family)
MDRANFIGDVRSRAAFGEDTDAEATIVAVLGVVGARLFENDARVVADQLPGAWASLLRREGPEEEFDLDGLYARVAEARGIELGPAVEQTQVVCQVLAEQVDDEGLQHLRLRVPPPIAELFTPRGPPPPAPERIGAPTPRAASESRRTLASGRPGSRNPLSEAPPPSGQSHSIAASDDPHADTKLASARGISTERDGEDLAAGNDRSDRSLASRDED